MTEIVPEVYTAALANDWDLVNVLLSNGADVTYVGPDEVTLFGIAIERVMTEEMLEIVISIIKLAIQQIKKQEDLIRYVCIKFAGKTILGNIVGMWSEERIIELIDICHFPEFINEPDSDGYTPLIRACINKDSAVAMKLLSIEGIELNAMTNDTGDTALHWACWKQLVEVAHRLIDLGANIHIISILNKMTPLMCAVYNKYSDLSLLLRLIELETNYDEENKYGETIMDLLIKERLEQCAVELVRKGYINLERVNSDDMTYLASACKYGMPTLAKIILDTGRGKPWHICVMSESYRPIAVHYAERNCKQILPELVDKIASLGYCY